MDASQHAETGPISRFTEILFSLNVGFAIAIILRVHLSRSKLGPGGLSDYALGMIGWINRVLHLRPRNQAGLELMFLAWIFAIAVFTWVLLKIVMPAKARLLTLGMVGGITALVAVPASLLYAYIGLYAGTTWSERFVDNNRAYLILEAAVAVVCLVFYFRRRWLISVWGTGVLLAFHYILWGGVISRIFSPTWWGLSLSAVPVCSGIAWILYVREFPTIRLSKV
jgi:hypothetical protein